MRAASVRVSRSYYFEYHCLESYASGDVAAWLRSHERVRVLGVVEPGGHRLERLRIEYAMPRVFKVEWVDGFTYDVFEDELLDSEADYSRPDPPKTS